MDEKGNEVWKYESRNNEDNSNSTDKLFFWGGQVLATLLWGIMFFTNFISFDFFWVLSLSKVGLAGFHVVEFERD